MWRHSWCSKTEEHEPLEAVEITVVSVLNQGSFQIGGSMVLFRLIFLEILQFNLMVCGWSVTTTGALWFGTHLSIDTISLSYFQPPYSYMYIQM